MELMMLGWRFSERRKEEMIQVGWGESLVILEEEAHVKERKLLLHAIR